mmetsp:Transcript_110483/g.356609  ORF Transcript_110483/g.356609 Transcript_110483/m.356609 type:complete len:167 (-) Transcript_110483:325-825(-)
MAEEEGSWDQTIEEWLISEGHCYAAALANAADGGMYAAAPQANEEGWGFVFKDAHEETVTQDDMTEKKMTIDETVCLFTAVSEKTKKTATGGFWLGGKKYTITQYQTEAIGDKDCDTIFANRPKEGVHIVKTPGDQVILGFFSEEPAVGICAQESAHRQRRRQRSC